MLLRLFDDAETVVDTIRIQRELSDVQLQIEEIEGRLRFLRDQTDMGTISLAIAEEGTAAPGAFDRALDRAVDGFLSVIAAMVVMIGYALPIALIALIVLVAYRRLRPGAAGARG